MPRPIPVLLVSFAFVLTMPGAGVSGVRPSAFGWRPHVAAARRYARTRLGEVAFAVIIRGGATTHRRS